MTTEQFDKILSETMKEVVSTIGTKGAEYTVTDDRLKNFKDAGRLLGCHPEAALLSFVSKHIIALKDLTVELNNGRLRPEAQWDEKTGDIIAYMVLLRALLSERFDELNGKDAINEDQV